MTNFDHRPSRMWDEFRVVRDELIAAHGTPVVKVNTPDLPIRLSSFSRMTTVWFLPDAAGIPRNHGFHVDRLRITGTGGRDVFEVQAWIHGGGSVSLRTNCETASLIRLALSEVKFPSGDVVEKQPRVAQSKIEQVGERS